MNNRLNRLILLLLGLVSLVTIADATSVQNRGGRAPQLPRVQPPTYGHANNNRRPFTFRAPEVRDFGQAFRDRNVRLQDKKDAFRLLGQPLLAERATQKALELNRSIPFPTNPEPRNLHKPDEILREYMTETSSSMRWVETDLKPTTNSLPASATVKPASTTKPQAQKQTTEQPGTRGNPAPTSDSSGVAEDSEPSANSLPICNVVSMPPRSFAPDPAPSPRPDISSLLSMSGSPASASGTLSSSSGAETAPDVCGREWRKSLFTQVRVQDALARLEQEPTVADQFGGATRVLNYYSKVIAEPPSDDAAQASVRRLSRQISAGEPDSWATNYLRKYSMLEAQSSAPKWQQPLDGLQSFHATTTEPGWNLDVRETVGAVHDWTKALTGENRALYNYRYGQGHTQQEAAETFGIPRRTLGDWDQSLRESLNQHLQKGGLVPNSFGLKPGDLQYFESLRKQQEGKKAESGFSWEPLSFRDSSARPELASAAAA